jgi:hypothetical protein
MPTVTTTWAFFYPNEGKWKKLRKAFVELYECNRIIRKPGKISSAPSRPWRSGRVPDAES